MNEPKEAIVVKNLRKVYASNGVEAVKGVSFSVHYGEIFGFLGPNGAGKSTTIKSIIGLIKATEGEIYLDGVDTRKHPHRVRMVKGYSSQESSLDDRLTAYENLFLQGKFFHLSNDEIEKRAKEVLGMFGLWERRNDLVEAYSGGMMKRLDIAEALIHRPRILFLDEPTLGLDIQTRYSIWAYIKKLREKYNMTIFLTTHYLEEADELCDRVGIIDNGKILALDKPGILKSQIGGDLITMTFGNEKEKIDPFLEKLKLVEDVKSINVLENNVYSLVAEKNGDQLIPKLFVVAQKEDITIESIRLKRPTLDDVYLTYTGRTIREAEGSREEAAKQRIKMRRVGR
jgi:ABC-2 type transport system ATP-binding protein